jgi:hypothetical protein
MVEEWMRSFLLQQSDVFEISKHRVYVDFGNEPGAELGLPCSAAVDNLCDGF